jgi:Na+-transporting methylmalonyl-CoA/oxaloacetate decarboxylase gamma subunit
MKWWKRLILSVISLIWGYISLDYLYLAFCYLTGSRAGLSVSEPGKSILWELFGFAMILLWLFLMMIYLWFIQKLSPHIDMIEKDKKSGREKVQRKRFDLVLQIGFVVTGVLIRWGYLCIWYFPNR